MKTKTLPSPTMAPPIAGNLKSKRHGDVKVVNAVASIHKIFEEIAPDGMIGCEWLASKTETVFVFSSGDVCATFHVQPLTKERRQG